MTRPTLLLCQLRLW